MVITAMDKIISRRYRRVAIFAVFISIGLVRVAADLNRFNSDMCNLIHRHIDRSRSIRRMTEKQKEGEGLYAVNYYKEIYLNYDLLDD